MLYDWDEEGSVKNINIFNSYLNHEFESFQLKDGLFNFVEDVEILAKYIIGNINEDIKIEKQKYWKNKKRKCL